MRIHKYLEGLTIEEKKEKLLDLISDSYPICEGLSGDVLSDMESGFPSKEWQVKMRDAGIGNSFSSEGGIAKPYRDMFGFKRGNEIGEWLHLRYRWDSASVCRGMMFHPNMLLPVEQLYEPEVEIIYYWARQLKGFMEAFDKAVRLRE